MEAADPKVQLFLDGRAAVVAYNYTCSFNDNGKRVKLTGRDLFTMVKEEDRWLAAADHFSCD